MRHIVTPLAIMIAAMPLPAAGQNKRGAKLLETVELCRSEADGSVRLACYDRAVDGLAEARRSGTITVLTAEEVEEQRRTSFGAARPRAPEITTLDSTVATVAIVGHDMYRVALADGSVWRTTEAVRIEPRNGDSVHIRRGALGSYLGSFDGARSLRLERVR